MGAFTTTSNRSPEELVTLSTITGTTENESEAITVKRRPLICNEFLIEHT